MVFKAKYPGKKVEGFFKVGTYASYLHEGSYTKEDILNIPIDFQPFEYGGVVGLGIKTRFSFFHMVFEIEDRFSFNDLTRMGDEHRLKVNVLEYFSFRGLFTISILFRKKIGVSRRNRFAKSVISAIVKKGKNSIATNFYQFSKHNFSFNFHLYEINPIWKIRQINS